jgi:periplasmic protein CpxP/Spy
VLARSLPPVYRSLPCEQGPDKGTPQNLFHPLNPQVTTMRQIAETSHTHTRSTLRHLTAFTLVMALAGAAADMAQAQPAGGMGGMPGKDGMTMQHGPRHAAHHPQGGHGGMMMSERMLDTVGASAEQKTRVRDILKTAQDEQRQQHEAGQALHQQMMQLMAAPKIDAAAAEALRQQQLARHDAASKRRLQAMLDVQAVLTPEQRAKMAEQMKARQDRMGRHQRENQALPMAAPRS